MNGERGFTLLEVVVATAVFALVVFVLGGYFVVSSSRSVLGQDVSVGTLLAQQRLETLRTRSYGSLPGYAGTETLDEMGTPTVGGPFTRVTTVTTPYLSTSRLTLVEVVVSWDERGTPRSVTLQTIFGDF